MGVTLLILLVVDFYFYDRISNEYLIRALHDRDVKHNVIVGSSKVKWSVIDSLMEEEPTVLAEGGQFLYASAGVILVLGRNGLLRGKNVFVDFEESDEIASGFGQWWYFSEAFLKYRYAALNDYESDQWLPVMSRILRDITHFGFNHEKKFKWEPLEKSVSHLNSHPDADSIEMAARNYRDCTKPFSKPYGNALVRIKNLFAQLEVDENCRIFVIIPPYPKAGCRSMYANIFGTNRIMDLTEINIGMMDFHDNSHLNTRGAIKFTSELDRLMKGI